MNQSTGMSHSDDPPYNNGIIPNNNESEAEITWRDLLVANLAFDLSAKKEYETFSISTANNEILILKTTLCGSTTESAAILLNDRNKELTEKIKNSYFRTSDGKFDQIFLFISSKLEEQKKYDFVINTGSNATLEIELSDTPNIISSHTTTTKCYKCKLPYTNFTHHEDLSKYQEYFKKLFVWPCVLNPNDLETEILRKFKEKFESSDTDVKKYLNFVIRHLSHYTELNKSIIENAITLILIEDNIQPIHLISRNKKYILLREAISKSDITFFKEDNKDIHGIYGDVNLEWSNTDKINSIVTKYNLNANEHPFISNTGNRTIAKILWLMDKVPLILKGNFTKLMRVINFVKKKRFILIQNRFDEPEGIRDCATFYRLSDLLRFAEDKYNQILEEFCVELQGMNFKLKLFESKDDKCSTDITTDDLIRLCNIDTNKKINENYNIYIDRSLSIIEIEEKYFNDRKNEALIVIDCLKNYPSFKSKLPRYEIIKSDLAHLRRSKNEIDTNIIYMCEDVCSEEALAVMTKEYHHLRLRKNGTLEWIKSTRCINEIKKFHVDQFVKELNYHSFDFPIILICSESGMGKSMLLESLRTKLTFSYFVIVLNEVSIIEYFQKASNYCNIESFINFVEKNIIKSKNSTEEKMIRLLEQARALIFAWDGLDKLSENMLEKVITMIDSVSKKGFKQIITSRDCLKKRLEKKFNIFARKLLPFTDKDKMNFIDESIEKMYPEDERSTLKKHITDIVTTKDVFKIFEVPLNIYILIELIGKNVNLYNIFQKQSVIALPYIYQHYVFHKVKTTIETVQIKKLINPISSEYIDAYVTNYEHLALKSILKKEHSKKVDNTSRHESFLQEIKKTKDPYHFILAIDENNDAQFAHLFREYFAASCLSKNLKWIEHEEQILINKEEYRTLRTFFDFFMCSDNNLLNEIDENGYTHLYKTCLKKDEKHVQTLLNLGASVNATCKNGHTPLYISCINSSWKIAQLLIDKGADINMSYDQGDTLLHIGCRQENYELCRFLVNIEKTEVDKRNNERMTALHLACKNKNPKITKLLLENRKASVDVLDGEGATPLHFACDLGCEKIVELLLECEADMNVEDGKGCTPMDLAHKKKHKKVLRLLEKFQKLKSQKTMCDNSGETLATNIIKVYKSRKDVRNSTNKNVMIAHCVLNLLKNKRCKNFYISIDNKDFKYFNDIIIERECDDSRFKTTAIRLAHAKNRPNISSGSLAPYKEVFNLIKKLVDINFEEKQCDQLLLFTNKNIRIKPQATHDFTIALGNEEFVISIELNKSDSNHIINSTNGCYYKFEVVTTLPEDATEEKKTVLEKYKLFFRKFYLYVNLTDIKEIKQTVCENFKFMFSGSETHFEKYLQFIEDWNKLKGNKYKFTKEFMGKVFVLLMTTIYETASDQLDKKYQLLSQAVSKFRITLFESNKEKVAQLWTDTVLSENDMKLVLELAKNYQLQRVTDIDKIDKLTKSKLLWLMERCPVIVSESEIIWKILEIFDIQNIVLLRENNNNFEVFKSTFDRTLTCLSDLESTEEIYQNILKTFTVCFQGRSSLTLDNLLSIDKKFAQIITANELLQMSEDTLRIGEPIEKLPDAYVPRLVSKITIQRNFLKQLHEDTMIVMSCSNINPNSENDLTELNLIDYNSLKNKNISISNSKNTIFVNKDKCSINTIKNIIPEKVNFHHFRMIEDGSLELLHTRGNESNLAKYHQECHIDELDLYKKCISNDITVICADPGMGKSTLTKNFKNNLDSDYWAVIITATDISQFLYQEKYEYDNFFNFALQTKYESGTKFEREIIRILNENRHVVFIWDGIDELSDEHLDEAVEIISLLSKKHLPQFVTSRSHLKSYLEEKLEVSAYSVKQFTEKQQREYIRSRLKDKYTEDKILQILEEIKLRLEQVHSREMLGIPLEIYMLTELFYQNAEKYLELNDNNFTLISLYEYYVREKFILCFKEKCELKTTNDFMERLINQYQENYNHIYEEVAVRSLLKEEDLKTIQINPNNQIPLHEIMHNDRDSHGLIKNINTDGSVKFYHDSFGEYFVAVSFYKYFKKIPNLKAIIFKPRYINIRFMFDLLMAKDNPLHLDVLHNKHFSETDISPNCTNVHDKGGRTPLHLLCSWDKKIDNILQWAKHFDWKENDNLFNLNAIQYADLMILSSSSDGSTLLHRAAEEENLDVLKMVLSKENVDKLDKHSLTPLHRACRSGKEESVRFLITSGASINAKCSNGFTPLYYAFCEKHFGVAQLLLEHGADINLTYEDNKTLLHIACQKGLEDFVQLCIDKKVNVLALDNDQHLALELADKNVQQKIIDVLKKKMDVANIQKEIFFVSCKNGKNADVKRILGEFPYFINIHDNEGKTPLHMAAQGSCNNTIEFLAQMGAKINCKDKNGRSPFYHASKSGSKDTVKLLLQLGANVYSKRHGTVDQGKEYEKYVTLYFILKCLKSDFPFFELWSNDAEFGDFDDIIMEIQEEKYAVQLKHVNNKRYLTPSHLQVDKSNFSIKKYFGSYKKIKNLTENYKLILWTNLDLRYSDKTFTYSDGDVTFTLGIIESSVSSLLSTSENTKCYRFNIIEKSSTSISSSRFKEYQNFFNNFVLYTNQAHVDILEKEIMNIIDENYSNEKSLFNNLTGYIDKWIKTKDDKLWKLDREIMTKVIALQLLDDYIYPFRSESTDEKNRIFKNAINEFDVTVFMKDSLEIVNKFWSVNKQQLSSNKQEINILLRQYQVSKHNKIDQMDDITCSILLWLMGKHPLVVQANLSTYKAIRLCEDEKFILIGKDIKDEFLLNKRVFRILSDLQSKSQDIFLNIVDKINCKIPGKKIKLSNLIKKVPEIAHCLTTDELLHMINQSFELKQKNETLPEVYIERSFYRNFIDSDFLHESSNEVVILISKVTEENKKLFKNCTFILVDDYMTGRKKASSMQKRIVFITRNECSQENFHTLCMKLENNKEYHHFTLNNGQLEWMESIGNVSNLSQNIIESGSQDETYFLEEQSRNSVKIVIGNPGMGKTVLLKKIKNHFANRYVTLLFTPTDISKLYDAVKENSDNIDNLESLITFPNCTKFEELLLKHLIKDGHVVYLWDALDELSDEKRLIVMKIISNLSSTSKMQIVASRRHLKNVLENKFGVLSKNITQFDSHQQSYYIEQRLKNIFPDKNKLIDVRKKIRVNVSTYSTTDILGIPLYIYMITELIRKDPVRFINFFSEMFNIIDLHRYFIEENLGS